MGKNICNVIWVDDDIENICPDTGMKGLKRELKEYNIEVIGKARSYLEFKQLLDICKDRVDAVITDANFNDISPAVTGDKDFKGLIKMIGVIESYNERRYIPFYLYSGKEEYFKFENGELDYFKVNNRKFKKGEYEKMFKKIREDVEHINSPSFRIRNKYKTELEAASLIDGNEERLMNALLYVYSDEWKNTEDYFNPMRKMVEAIFEECKELCIIPEINKLNGISCFIGGGKHSDENYRIIEGQEIMPKTLARSLWYFLDIVQDASHDAEKSSLKVDDYIRKTKNTNLFRSVLHIAMDLCLWYKQVKEETELPDFTPKWENIETHSDKDVIKCDDSDLDLSSQKEAYEGGLFTPEVDENGIWHCKKCAVGLHTWDNKGSIRIKEIIYNTNPKTKHTYPFYAKFDILKE